MMPPFAIERFTRWVEAASTTVVGLLAKFSKRQVLAFEEREDGLLALLAHAPLPSGVVLPQLRIMDDGLEAFPNTVGVNALAGLDVRLLLNSVRFSLRSLEL